MSYETVIYEKKEGVAVITLNRPEKRNAISLLLSQELVKALDEASKDKEVGAVVLTGGPKCFCAGADLAAVQDSDTGKPPVEPGMLNKISDFPKPLIAAIGGPCVAGGLEIAMACDIRIASETARIGDGHIKMGLLGPAGGTSRLPRIVGAGIGKELIFTGDLINGAEACRIGLVNHAYPEDQFINEAVELGKRIAKNPPNALRISKRAIDIGLQMSEYDSLHYSEFCSEDVTNSAEYKELVEKFLNKK